MRRLLYSLSFIISSLFAVEPTIPFPSCSGLSGYYLEYNPAASYTQFHDWQHDYQVYPVATESCPTTTNLYSQSTYPDFVFSQVWERWEGTFHYDVWTRVTSCTPPLEPNASGFCVEPPPPPIDCSSIPNTVPSADNTMCECNLPFLFVNTGNDLTACQPDTDFDGKGDTTEDPYPGDTNNDGVPGIDPNEPTTDSPPDPIDDSLCSKYPRGNELGFTIASNASTPCTTDFLNSKGIDGGSTYYKKVYPLTCEPECLAYFTECLRGGIYSYADRGCVQPTDAPAECTENTEPSLAKEGDTCYNQFYCTDGRYSRRVLTECPDTNNDGVPDDNVTSATSEAAMISALTNYGASTSVKQDEMINLLDTSNQKLNDIKNNTDKLNSLLTVNNTSLDSISSKMDTLNTSTTSQNTKLDGIKASIDGATNQNSLENTNIASKLDDLSSKLDDIKSTESNVSGISGDFSTELGELNTALSGFNGIETDITALKDNVVNGLNENKTLYDDLKLILQNGITIETPPAATTCAETITHRGHTYTLDPCLKVSEYSTALYSLFFMFGLFISALGFYKLFMQMGGE